MTTQTQKRISQLTKELVTMDLEEEGAFAAINARYADLTTAQKQIALDRADEVLRRNSEQHKAESNRLQEEVETETMMLDYTKAKGITMDEPVYDFLQRLAAQGEEDAIYYLDRVYGAKPGNPA